MFSLYWNELIVFGIAFILHIDLNIVSLVACVLYSVIYNGILLVWFYGIFSFYFSSDFAESFLLWTCLLAIDVESLMKMDLQLVFFIWVCVLKPLGFVNVYCIWCMGIVGWSSMSTSVLDTFVYRLRMLALWEERFWFLYEIADVVLVSINLFYWLHWCWQSVALLEYGWLVNGESSNSPGKY